MKHTSALSFFLLAQTACAIEAPGDFETVEQDIINGSPIGSFTGQVWLEEFGCTGTMLTEHWILTAAHCVHGKPSAGRTQVFTSPTYTGAVDWTRPIYEGPRVHFTAPGYHHDPDANNPYDIALVHLSSYGASLSSIDRAKIYADPVKRPWYDGSLPYKAYMSGYGKIGSSCQTANSPGTLYARMSNLQPAPVTNPKLIFADLAHCDSDSGGPWHYPITPSQHVQFAVHNGRDHDWPSGDDSAGTMIAPSLPWIEATIASRMPKNFQLSINGGSVNGHAYRRYVERINTIAPIKHGAWCLEPTGDDGSPVRLGTCGNDVREPWLMTAIGEIRNIQAGGSLCLTVDSGSNYDGLGLHLEACNGSLVQRFRFDKEGWIHSGLDYNRCLDVQWGDAYDGAFVQLWGCNGTAAQVWTM